MKDFGRGNKVTGRGIHHYNAGFDCKNASKREVSQDEANSLDTPLWKVFLVALLLITVFGLTAVSSMDQMPSYNEILNNHSEQIK